MPRELLLPIPHAIADKVHHLFLDAAESYAVGVPKPAEMHAFLQLAEKLDTLAREAGVIGW